MTESNTSTHDDMSEETDDKPTRSEGGFTATCGSVSAGAVLYAALMDTWPVPPRFETLSDHDKHRLERAAFKVIALVPSQNDQVQ